jgi:uroporphyrin-III C-methyltransferase/precorrin-2 dehydrogenase/sirohydrochlorin ferrochelatase
MVHMVKDSAIYPVGLRLSGRRVVVVGAGQVAQRRIPGLLSAGARVTVVSPDCTPTIEGLADSGQVTLIQRKFEDSDLNDTWYVIAATASAEVNQRVLAVADENRIFCVRSDDASETSAVTPATGTHQSMTVAVLPSTISARNPRHSAQLRDEIVTALDEGGIPKSAMERTPGVVLVGGGPGDPDLITVAGRKELMNADVVIADRLAPQAVLGELPTTVEVIDVAKLPRGRSAQQTEINRLIVEHAKAGKRVVRFKGGDSFVFGRGHEEVQACNEAQIAVTVVPGISSPIAVPALAGIPITNRGTTHSFTVISGHLPPGHPDSLINWSALAQITGTLVLMMAIENAPAICNELIAGGRAGDTQVAIISDGSTENQRRVDMTLSQVGLKIREYDIKPPAIIVIGEVVGIANGRSD